MIPGLPAIAIAQGIEKNKIFQPPRILGTESVKFGMRTGGPLVQKTAGSPFEEWQLVSADFVVIDCGDGVAQPKNTG